VTTFALHGLSRTFEVRVGSSADIRLKDRFEVREDP